MGKSYAFAAKQVALWAVFLCFIIILIMIYPILQPPQNEPQFVCGNAIMEMSLSSDVKNGKMLFIANCAQCHAKNMKDALTGPPLSEWHQYFKDEKEVLKYINNPKNYKTKNKQYKKMLKEYQPSECTPFPTLTQEDVAALISYIDRSGY